MVIKALAIGLEHLTGWVFIVLTSLTLTQVFCRYALNSPLVWSEELVIYLCVWLTYLGAAVLTAKKTHLRLGMGLVARVAPGLAGPISILLELTIFACLVLLTWQVIRFTVLSSILRSPALRIPMWWVWVAVPANGALMMLFVGHSLVTTFRDMARRT
jgi:TRAP-type C4-dicarboxylate transport system permease small subunit